MSFIAIYPFNEIEQENSEQFGRGQPARVQAEDRFSARNIYLNVHEIAAFEECPLYLITPEETDALVNGIRLRLRSGGGFVLADDPGEDEENFLECLQRALAGEIVEMPFSRYLRELQRSKK